MAPAPRQALSAAGSLGTGLGSGTGMRATHRCTQVFKRTISLDVQRWLPNLLSFRTLTLLQCKYFGMQRIPYFAESPLSAQIDIYSTSGRCRLIQFNQEVKRLNLDFDHLIF
jgi:hypothetical protein